MKYVLFVCTHNAGRSQIAQGFFERHAPPDVRAESAGSTPASEIWPTVVEVMDEVGIDLRARRPRKLMVEMQLHADWAVTIGCGDICPYVPTTVEDWDLPDPAGKSLDEVRAIRDTIEERVHDLVVERLDAIRSDADGASVAARAGSFRRWSRNSATATRPRRSVPAPMPCSRSTATRRCAALP
jgi:arsenate reductase